MSRIYKITPRNSRLNHLGSRPVHPDVSLCMIHSVLLKLPHRLRVVVLN